mmetsp:Transcript_1655/g.2342  ORF Transcript_1655/g.2342 Transcript_1655/m.2342 type:complete len:239 (-) Transcript_1655:1843-2559(-)
MESISAFWQQHLNSEETFLPFYITFSVYASLALYCHLVTGDSKAFNNWLAVHNSHNSTGLVLAAISIWMDNDTILKERTIIQFSYGYFLVDFIDTVVTRNWTYTFHALIVMIIGSTNWIRPLHRQLRFHSKAYVCEFSSPFLHKAQRTRKPLDFILFAIAFTACRIIWFPTIIYQSYQGMNGFHWTSDFLMPCYFAFYALQLFWWYKIIRILIRGRKEDKDGTSKTEGGDEKSSTKTD